MIRWDEGDGKKGAFDRYEILLVMQDDSTWELLIWVRKTLVDRAAGMKSKEDAQAQAEKIVAQLHRNAKRLEEHLFADEYEDEMDEEHE